MVTQERSVRSELLTFRLSVEEKRRLIEVARAQDRAPGQVVRRAILESLALASAESQRLDGAEQTTP